MAGNLQLMNCTVTANSASGGAGIYSIDDNTVLSTNSIFWTKPPSPEGEGFDLRLKPS
jgi:hypothetical protein